MQKDLPLGLFFARCHGCDCYRGTVLCGLPRADLACDFVRDLSAFGDGIENFLNPVFIELGRGAATQEELVHVGPHQVGVIEELVNG